MKMGSGEQTYKYDAFVSYSHSVDGKLAPDIQNGLQRFAKRWFQRRALRVFRDTTTLAMTDQLWPSIKDCLNDSDYLVLLASPEAAASVWVQRELEEWLSERTIKKILLVLTNGEIQWDEAAGDFDWEKTTALPETLRSVYQFEPKYVDLRFASSAASLTMKRGPFRDAIIDLAATIHGRDKDEIAGEDLRQHRNRKIAAAGIGVGFLTLCIVAAFTGLQWVKEKEISDQERVRAKNAAIAKEEAEARARIEGERKKEAQQQAKWRSADARFRNAESLRADARWADAQPHYLKAIELYREIGQSPLRAQMGLWQNYRESPPSLISFQIPDIKMTRIAVSEDHSRVLVASTPIPEGIVGKLTEGSLQEMNRLLAEQRKSLGAKAKAYVYHLASGQLAGTMSPGCEVTAATFWPNGQFAVVGCSNGAVYTWEVDRVKSGTLASPGGAEIRALQFSQDGSLFVAGDANGTVTVWQVNGWKLLKRFLAHQGAAVTDLSFAAEDRFVVTAGADGMIRQFNPDTWALMKEVKVFDDPIYNVKASYGTVYAGTVMGDFKAWFPDRRMKDIAFSPTLSSVAPQTLSSSGIVARYDRDNDIIRLWDMLDALSLGGLSGRDMYGVEIEISGDNRVVVAVSLLGRVTVWPLTYGQVGEPASRQTLEFAAVSPNGLLAATATSGANAYFVDLWDTATSRRIRRFSGHRHRPKAIEFSPDNSLLISGDGPTLGRPQIAGCTVQIRDIATGNIRHTLKDHQGPVQAVAFSPDGRYAVSGDKLGTVIYWRVQDGANLWTVRHHKRRVTSVAISPDGKTIATGGFDDHLRLLDARTGEELRHFDATDWVRDVIFTHHGQQVLIAAESGLYLWDFLNGAAPEQLVGHEGSVLAVARTPGAGLALSAGNDGTIRLWDLESRSEVLWLPLNYHTAVRFGSASELPLIVPGTAVENHLASWCFQESERLAALQKQHDATLKSYLENPSDPLTLQRMGEWYALNGLWDWAVILLQQASTAGADEQALLLAQGYHRLGDKARADQYYRLARSRGEASSSHIDLLLGMLPDVDTVE